MFLFNPVPNEMCCLIIIIVMVIHVSNHNLVFQFIPFWALECFPSPRILSQSKVWVLDWSWEIFRSLEVQIISRSRLLPADLLRGQQIFCSFLSFIIFDLSLKYFKNSRWTCSLHGSSWKLMGSLESCWCWQLWGTLVVFLTISFNLIPWPSEKLQRGKSRQESALGVARFFSFEKEILLIYQSGLDRSDELAVQRSLCTRPRCKLASIFTLYIRLGVW